MISRTIVRFLTCFAAWGSAFASTAAHADNAPPMSGEQAQAMFVKSFDGVKELFLYLPNRKEMNQ